MAQDFRLVLCGKSDLGCTARAANIAQRQPLPEGDFVVNAFPISRREGRTTNHHHLRLAERRQSTPRRQQARAATE
jgi:hypothetical protein